MIYFARNNKFMKEITEKVKEKLDISKLEDGNFRYTGIDAKRIEIKLRHA